VRAERRVARTCGNLSVVDAVTKLVLFFEQPV
jgi:hypothetical protein